MRSFDFAIVGSGFGGSVAALRLAQKGYSVVVLEQGRRIGAKEIDEAADHSPRRFVWEPRLGMDGYFTTTLLRHVSIVGGVGVGGGSLVYGAVLLEPKDAFYADPAWAHLGVDWKRELAPHFATASRMLGVAENPTFGAMDEYLRCAAESLGAGDTFGPTPNAIYFGQPGRAGALDPDPYFDGDGPARTACVRCGACMTGCRYGSKNSLDQNYLYLAERLGVEVRPLRRVTRMERQGSGYTLQTENPLDRTVPVEKVEATRVVLAAGVLGTLDLLFRARDEHQTLPQVSPVLGSSVRTNSEAIVGILHRNPPDSLATEGTAISSHFFLGGHTHITQNRYGKAWGFQRFFSVPMVDDPHPLRRALRTLASELLMPWKLLRHWFARDWYKRITVLTVMQDVDNQMRLSFGRSLLSPLRKALRSEVLGGSRPPAYLPEANRAARALAACSGGEPYSLGTEALANASVTAHILGGAPMGRSAEDGVIGTDHEVFGYPGLYVVDGAAVGVNVGVNPSLTITAMAERAMAGIPEKGSDETS